MAGFKVGEDVMIFVGVKGKVSEVVGDTLTVAGHKLPIRMGDGVVYLSDCEAPASATPAAPLPAVASGVRYVNDGYCDRNAYADAVVPILEAAHRAHDDAHVGNFAYCDNPICKAVREEANA